MTDWWAEAEKSMAEARAENERLTEQNAKMKGLLAKVSDAIWTKTGNANQAKLSAIIDDIDACLKE